jgi:hypothetical protein
VPRIIRDLPFLDQPRVVEVGGELVRIKPYQVVVWVSLADLGAAPFDTRTPRIPAVYDTGKDDRRKFVNRPTGTLPSSISDSIPAGSRLSEKDASPGYVRTHVRHQALRVS